MTEGTEEKITDPEEVPAKRSRRGAPRKPRVPRKTPPPAYIQLSPALQSELRKLQHAAARGSSADKVEWARVSRAADKALALLLPDRWEFQLATTVRISGSSVSLRRNSLMQHNGYMMRQWAFVWVPHVKTTLRVLDIVDAASEMHIAIQNLIVRRWDRWKAMTSICDKLENFRQCLMSCRM